MIKAFRDSATQDIFDGTESKSARKALPLELRQKARRSLDLINGAANLQDLAIPPGNRLEALKGDRKGFHSIRINDQYRIVFRWVKSDAEDVEIVDYHGAVLKYCGYRRLTPWKGAFVSHAKNEHIVGNEVEITH